MRHWGSLSKNWLVSRQNILGRFARFGFGWFDGVDCFCQREARSCGHKVIGYSRAPPNTLASGFPSRQEPAASDISSVGLYPITWRFQPPCFSYRMNFLRISHPKIEASSYILKQEEFFRTFAHPISCRFLHVTSQSKSAASNTV